MWPGIVWKEFRVIRSKVKVRHWRPWESRELDSSWSEQKLTKHTYHKEHERVSETGVFPSLDGVSGTLCLSHYVTEISHLYSLRDFRRHFGLCRAAAHIWLLLFFAPCTTILTYLLTYCGLDTNWLCFQGDGLKGEGHSNVHGCRLTDGRFAVVDHRVTYNFNNTAYFKRAYFNLITKRWVKQFFVR